MEQMQIELPGVPAKRVTAAAPLKSSTREIGYAQAVNQYWWLYEGEDTPELQWPQSVSVFDAMRRTDAQVASVLRAVNLPVRRTPWRIEPAGARAKVVKFVADDLGLPIVGKAPGKPPPRTRDKFSWQDHLRLALLELVYGHMFFEQVYRVNDAGTEAHLRKLAPRMPKTIERIDVASDGGLISIQQYWTDLNRSPEPIPSDRLVAYVHDREGGNWLGQSILRPAYKNWLIKDRLLRVQAQTIERNGMGVPLYIAAETETDLSQGLGLATSWRSGEAAGSSIPFGANLVLRGVEGTLPDADPAIRYHDEQIARAVLAHFLNLGTQTGSWALGATFADFFVFSLQTLAQQLADVTTQHVIEDLVDVNFGPDEPAPKLVFDEIGSQQAATAQALKLLVDAGVIHPDQVLEETSRQQYGLPAADPATATPVPAATPAAGQDVVKKTPSAKPGSVAAAFNPGERRDGDGKWTDGPGGAAGHAVGDIAGQLAKAAGKQDALDAAPAKLTRAPGGHRGDYTGEGLTGPSGIGTARALSEYEGLEYVTTNSVLRTGQIGDPGESATKARVAEIDKTMAASRLQADVKVDRVIQSGSAVFGEKNWLLPEMLSADFDVQDAGYARWDAGERPDLTGLRWLEKGYSSTTADPSRPAVYGDRWRRNAQLGSGESEPVIMTILVPEGTGGVQLSEMGHEAEILLQRDLTFEVAADHGVDGEGFRRIDVRVVPDGA